MYKKAVVLAVVVAITLVAGPYLLGAMAEERLRHELSQYESKKIFPPGVSVILKDYQRGWLRSSALTTLVIDLEEMGYGDLLEDSAAAEKRIELDFSNEIQHGPIVSRPSMGLALASVNTRIVVPEAYKNIVSYYFPDGEPFNQHAVISFDDRLEATYSVPPYQGKSHVGDITIAWEGMQGEVQGSIDDKYVHKATIPLISIAEGDAKLVLKSVHLGGDAAYSANGIAIGDVVLSAESLKVRFKADNGVSHILSASDVAVRAKTDITNGLLDIAEEFSFASISLNEHSVGRGLLHVDINNIDADSFTEYQEIVWELQRNGFDDEEMRAALAEQAPALISKVLRRSPRLSVSQMQVETDHGVVAGHFKLSFDAKDDADIILSAESLMPRLGLDTHIKVPEALVRVIVASMVAKRMTNSIDASGEQPDAKTLAEMQAAAIDATLGQITAMNLLKLEEGYYSASLQYNEGKLMLNGSAADHIMQTVPQMLGGGVL